MPGRPKKSREERDVADDLVSSQPQSQQEKSEPVTTSQASSLTSETPQDPNPTSISPSKAQTEHVVQGERSDFAKALSEALKDQSVKKGFEDIFMPMVASYVKSYVSESLKPYQEKLEDLEMDMVVLKSNLDDLKDAYDTTITTLQQRVRDLERQARAKNLRITGLRPADTEDSTISLHQRFSTSLMKILDEAGITGITPHEVTEFVNIKLPAVSGNYTNVIVKFSTEKARDLFYSQRTKLKNCTGTYYVNEDLTKHDAAIFKRTRLEVKSRKLHSCWSRGGMIWAKATAEGKPFHIHE